MLIKKHIFCPAALIQTQIVIIKAIRIHLDQNLNFTGQESYSVFLLLSMLHTVPMELEIVKVETQLRIRTVKLDSCHRFIDWI